jgi:hypothetical protein
MPCPSNEAGFGFSLSDSTISFGIVIEGMLRVLFPAFDSPAMPANTAPAPKAEESKNERREDSTGGCVVFSTAGALGLVLILNFAFLRQRIA